MTTKDTTQSNDLRNVLPHRVFDLRDHRGELRAARDGKTIHVVIDCTSRQLVGCKSNVTASLVHDIAKVRRELGMTIVNIVGSLDPEDTRTCKHQAPTALSHARLSKLSEDELLDLIFEQASSDDIVERYNSLACCPAQGKTDESS